MWEASHWLCSVISLVSLVYPTGYCWNISTFWECCDLVLHEEHRSLIFVCYFSSACIGLAKEDVASSAGLGDFMACVFKFETMLLGRKNIWIGKKNICFLWECVPCEMLVGSQKNPPFLRSSRDGRTHCFGQKNSSASSCELEQQHQNARGKCRNLCNVVTALLVLHSVVRCFWQNKITLVSLMFWTKNVIT